MAVKAPGRFFSNRTSLFDAMPAVWQHLSELERRVVCSLFDTFDGVWSADNLRKVMALGFVKIDDIDKLRGCFLTSKEDPSVFVEPNAIPNTEHLKKESWQWMLDEDYSGFSFLPQTS